MKNKLLLLFIISIFTIIFIIFYKGLKNTNVYTPDIKINKEVPSFTSELFYSNEVVKSKEIFDLDKFYLLNIWSSWCAPCRQEHSLLMDLMETKKIKIIGVNYKDTKKNAESFLSELGNPFYQTVECYFLWGLAEISLAGGKEGGHHVGEITGKKRRLLATKE